MPSLDFEIEKTTFREYYESNRDLLDEAKDSFIGLVGALLRDASTAEISKIEGRVKDKEECIQKFSRKYRQMLESNATPYRIAAHISDLIGLRVVCLYEDQIAAIRNTLCNHFVLIEVTDKIANIENTESSFGYKGLHLDMRLNPARAEMPEYRRYAEFPFEIQVRTIVQDSWSVLDHKIKYKKSIPNRLKRRINTLAALFELADREFREVRVATDEEIRRAQSELDIQEEDESVDPITLRTSEPSVLAATTNSNAKAGTIEVTLPASPKSATLDAFMFLRIANHFFPLYDFEPHKVDGFVQEIVTADPTATRSEFNRYMRTTISTVKRYKSEFEGGIAPGSNPFTIMRHCLYLFSKEKFSGMLTNVARENFEKWLQSHPAI